MKSIVKTAKKIIFVLTLAMMVSSCNNSDDISEIFIGHDWRLTYIEEGGIRRFSDDGEPQGTAGIPCLDVLLKEDVTDVCVVVTRYFGGIKLGAGGLVRAYSKSVMDAIGQAEIVEIEGHPFFIGVQFHPEFTSRPGNPNPIFKAFIAAALTHV